MVIGKVVGTVVSTRKSERLVGSKFLIVEPLEQEGQQRLVAVDTVGAGVGETVLVTLGSAARVACGTEVPVDAAIVGIVDQC